MRKGLLYTACWIFLLISCAEDLGNYDYRELSSPVVTGIDGKIPVRKFERLQLTPQIEGEQFTEKDYSFGWKVIPQTDADTAIVIGNERILNYEVVLAEGIYTLYFQITNRTSGLYWQQTYELEVTQTTSEGWMVLCSEGGRTRLDMISMVTGEIYRDLLSSQDMPELNGPRRIQQLEGLTEEGSPFYLLTDDGATRLSNDGFAWKEEYNIRYEMGNGQTVSPHEIVPTVEAKMMVAGTNFHYASNIGEGILGLFSLPINKDFQAAPMAGSNISGNMILAPLVMIYDTDNKRFMGYGHNLAGEIFNYQEPLQEMNEMAELMEDMKATTGGVTGSAFDIFPTGLDYVYMENTRYDPGSGQMAITYTVLANGDERHLYGIQLGDMLPQSWSSCPNALGKAYYGDLSGCTDITEVTDLFAFSSLKNCMYYAVGGTLYQVDLSTKPLQAKVQFTLPGGEEITRLTVNLFRKNTSDSRSYNLIVGSLRGEEGILRIYRDTEMNGDFSGVEPEVYDGFARIVDVTYREW
ncbi:MAG: PKD-like family lipoprotein [Odoribacter splanchnicus]